MVAVDGLLDPEAGATLLAALEPLARPTSAEDERNGSQRRADALFELARRALESGRLPQTGGVRPQLTVTVELASLLTAEAGMPGGDGGWAGMPGGDGGWAGMAGRVAGWAGLPGGDGGWAGMPGGDGGWAGMPGGDGGWAG